MLPKVVAVMPPGDWHGGTSSGTAKRGVVPRAGLEPAPLAGPDFESGVATNYTTEASHHYNPAGCAT